MCHTKGGIKNTVKFKGKIQSIQRTIGPKIETLISMFEAGDDKTRELILNKLPEIEKNIKSIHSLVELVDNAFEPRW
jgi:archaellum component FlaC